MEKMVSKLEKNALNEQRSAEREKEREAQRRERERLREEQGIDREIRKLMEFLIRKVEKQEKLEVPEDDGRAYIDPKLSKPVRGRRVNTYKMRGMPCKEWFEVKDASLRRNPEFELEIKAAIKVIREQAAARKRTHAVGPPIQKQPKREYSWASPEEYDGNWSVIHIRCR